MVDVNKDFQQSWKLLEHHKKIVLPVFFSVLLPLVFISIFVNASGLAPLLREYAQAQKDFDQQKLDYLTNTSNVGVGSYGPELLSYLGKEADDSAYEQEFSDYLEQRGLSGERFIPLMTLRNLLLLVVCVSIAILGSFYLTCMSYAIIALSIKGERLTIGTLISATHHFLFRLLSLRIIMALIVVTPFVLLVLIGIGAFLINTILGVILLVPLFLILLAIICYVIYISIRLFFIIPSMYVNDEGPARSISHSYRLTRGHITQVLIVFAIVWGLNLLLGSMISQPKGNLFGQFLFASNAATMFLYCLLAMVFVLLEAIVVSFENVFLFYSYVDFKSFEESMEVSHGPSKDGQG
jgi:hypothetical protein